MHLIKQNYTSNIAEKYICNARKPLQTSAKYVLAREQMCFESMGVQEAHQVTVWHFNSRDTLVALNLDQFFYVNKATVFSASETATRPAAPHHESNMPTGAHICAIPTVITQHKWRPRPRRLTA